MDPGPHWVFCALLRLQQFVNRLGGWEVRPNAVRYHLDIGAERFHHPPDANEHHDLLLYNSLRRI